MSLPATLRPFAASLLVGGLAVGVLAGCGTSANEAGETDASTIDNCGTTVEVGKAPERIVTIKSTSTELVLALGLGDKLVGQAFSDGPVPPEYAGAASSVPEISEKAPSQEAVLELEPDLIFAGWESNLTADTAGDRATLGSMGVKTYVSPAACQEPAYQPDPMTFDLLFDDFAEAGRLLGHTAEADKLIADQRADLAKVAPVSETTALWWSSGTETPFVGAGAGAPQMVMEAVGLTNIAGDVNDTWASLGWETIVEANPDVLVLVDAEWNSAAKKIAFLESNPATARLDAVVNKRYLTVPFPASEAGVRSVGAAVSLSNQLAKVDLE